MFRILNKWKIKRKLVSLRQWCSIRGYENAICHLDKKQIVAPELVSNKDSISHVCGSCFAANHQNLWRKRRVTGDGIPTVANFDLDFANKSSTMLLLIKSRQKNRGISASYVHTCNLEVTPRCFELIAVR